MISKNQEFNELYKKYNLHQLQKQIIMREQREAETQVQLQSQSFLESLRDIQGNINEDITKMSNLKTTYHQSQEKKFLLAFVNIMDRMSDELQKANQMYNSIDKQVENDEQCIHLSTELADFQNQCIKLKRTLRHKQQKLQEQKMREKMLKKQKEYLKKRLYQQTYKQTKYKSKLEVANTKNIKKSSNYHNITQSNQTYYTRSRSMHPRNKQIDINDNIYEQIYKKRPKSLRHATSYKAENKQSATMCLSNKKSAIFFSKFNES